MLKWPVMKYKQCVQLGQLFFPLRQIRYYPPRFILRNPVVEGVSKALQKGYEVALIVYKIKNMSNLNQRFGYDEVKQITGRLRTKFKVDFVQGYYYARPQLFNQQLLSSI